MRRLAVLMQATEDNAEAQHWVASLREGLRKAGWAEGRNLRIDYRWGGTDTSLLQRFAKEIVAAKPDLIFSSSSPTTHMLKQETSTIPIVFGNVVDPIGQGFVASHYVGSLPKALADLNEASELNPKLAYTALWLDIVNKRSNLASRLQQAVAQIDMTHWPAPVIRLFLGQMTPAAVLAAADDPDPDTKKSHICEARFYSGELALLRDAKAEAAPLFKAAAESCPRTFTGDAAVAELKRL